MYSHLDDFHPSMTALAEGWSFDSTPQLESPMIILKSLKDLFLVRLTFLNELFEL